jgi:uncharacterized metal-binding protein
VTLAAELKTVPPLFDATTRKRVSLSTVCNGGVAYVAEPAPAMALQLTPRSIDCCHCSVGVGVPVVATLKVARPPAFTVWSDGCRVMEGATRGDVTVSLAMELVAEPETLLATTRK